MQLEGTVVEEQELDVPESQSLLYERPAALGGLALWPFQKQPAGGDVLEQVLHAYGGAGGHAAGDNFLLPAVVHCYAVSV